MAQYLLLLRDSSMKITCAHAARAAQLHFGDLRTVPTTHTMPDTTTKPFMTIGQQNRVSRGGKRELAAPGWQNGLQLSVSHKEARSRWPMPYLRDFC